MLPIQYLLLLLASHLAASARIEDLLEPTAPEAGDFNSNSSLVWQPLRATFRPLNRSPPPARPQPPPFPAPSRESSDAESLVAAAASSSDFDSFASDALRSFGSSRFEPPPTITPPPPPPPTIVETTTTPPPPTTTPAPPIRLLLSGESNGGSNNNDDDLEDRPTRVPLNRFRPTKAPTVDRQSQPSPVNLFAASQNNSSSSYRITNECFECICEASTNCNPNSRCQTSDVRHTRCGMMLISYDQWLETGLSRQLVSREALARDAAADERAFYECVTNRDCAERLMAIYMQKNARDCDRDGRIDCYDMAAIHQGGVDQCNSESLLDSQYWSDFNACFGFGR